MLLLIFFSFLGGFNIKFSGDFGIMKFQWYIKPWKRHSYWHYEWRCRTHRYSAVPVFLVLDLPPLHPACPSSCPTEKTSWFDCTIHSIYTAQSTVYIYSTIHSIYIQHSTLLSKNTAEVKVIINEQTSQDDETVVHQFYCLWSLKHIASCQLRSTDAESHLVRCAMAVLSVILLFR